MRAFVCSSLTEPPAYAEFPVPVLGLGQIRINVQAAGINFADTLIVKGQYQEKPALPFVPGLEVSGIVAELGRGVQGFAIGDRVLGVTSYGGYAEEAVLDAGSVYKIPDSLGFEAAAAFPITYGTAHGGLDWRAKLQPGETLLVHGAAGGVGLAAVKIGKLMGATVIATASTPEKLEIARLQGADHLILSEGPELRDQIKAAAPRGIDVAFDPVGGALFDVSLRTVAFGGRLIVIGFAGGKVPQIPANIVLVKNIDVIGYYWGGYREKTPADDPGFPRDAARLDRRRALSPRHTDLLSAEQRRDGDRASSIAPLYRKSSL